MSLTVANLLIFMCRVSPTERKELRVGCLMILKEGHGSVANWPATRKLRKWEIRSVHSLFCCAVSISSEAMPGVSSFGTEKASSYQNVFWSLNICNKYRY